MHDLLDQLRNHTPVRIAHIERSGGSMAVTLRFAALTAMLHCSGSGPAGRNDVELRYRGQSLRVNGASAAEQAGRIWSWCQWQSEIREPAGREPRKVMAES
ncbi:hypothetical protein AHIS1636_34150 [Arthrobacter mangrovi]|uniref:Uncharacterized protein n=1 Tax=Arthrobacter mangrovi TaxID=2966350 RepID=A0ABQ5MZ49_9MICC|nr:hypothetical protein AHIS1636_34150 [Arthrobacter mangrovi]